MPATFERKKADLEGRVVNGIPPTRLLDRVVLIS